MTTPRENPVAASVPAANVPITAAGILLAGHYRVDALARLVAANVRRARRYVLSPMAEELIAGLPFTRWSHAVARPLLLPDDPMIFVERPLRPGDLPAFPQAIGGLGVLLSPPSRPGAQRGNTVVSVVAARVGDRDRVKCMAMDHLCPILRGPPVADLAAAFPLVLRGVLKAVPMPAEVPGQDGVDWLVVPVGSGTA